MPPLRTKDDYRAMYRAKRNALTTLEREERSLAIANKMLLLDIWDHEYYHIFLPSARLKEINTEYLLSILSGKDKHIVVPKVIEGSKNLEHYLLTDGTKLVNSPWGIPEPQSGIQIEPKQLDVVFVPLLACDVHGNRLGYGKGYYDRFFAACRPECLKIGMTYFNLSENLPNAIDDVRLDICITPHNINVIE